jgi:hypothetical protein
VRVARRVRLDPTPLLLVSPPPGTSVATIRQPKNVFTGALSQISNARFLARAASPRERAPLDPRERPAATSSSSRGPREGSAFRSPRDLVMGGAHHPRHDRLRQVMRSR